jgi:hypothetical protein
MKIRYKCPCMDDYAEIDAPDRPRGRRVLDWITEEVSKAISSHHVYAHPRCTATHVDSLMTPDEAGAFKVLSAGYPEIRN